VASLRKRWFALECSVYREPWSREQKLTLAMLGMHMMDRWASDGLTPEQACTVRLQPGDLLTITGCESVSAALEAMRALAREVSMNVKPLANGFTLIEWPKFSETQQLGVRSPGAKRPVNAPSPPAERPVNAPPNRTVPNRSSSSAKIEKTTVSSSCDNKTPPETAGDGGLQSSTGTPEPDHEGEIAARVEELRVRLRDRSTDDRNLRAIVTLLPWPEIETAVYEAWSRFRDGIVSNPTAYFVGTMKRVAREREIDLGFKEVAA